MTISAIVRALVQAGATPAMILAAVEAAEAANDGALQKRRAADASRQAAKRERDAQSSHVTSRDVTVTDCDNPSPASLPEKKVSPDPSKKTNPLSTPIPPSQPSAVREVAKSTCVDPLPIAEAFEIWDRMAGKAGLSRVRDRTDQRCRHLRSRLAIHGLSGWTEAVETVAQSPFLVGSNDRGWKANFDFVVKAENFAKIREGSYDRNPSTGPPKPRRFGDEFADFLRGETPPRNDGRTIDGSVQRR